jgi:hypothetical protein
MTSHFILPEYNMDIVVNAIGFLTVISEYFGKVLVALLVALFLLLFLLNLLQK